jgi:hypothetical protein
VVLALNAPYYLDTTEINKLDAFFCAYGKTEPFVEVSVRALFGELSAEGASPVTIEGIGYDLAFQLSPDPNQPMAARLSQELTENPLPPVTVHLTAGPVLDRNGHPVPDGTTVTFAASYRGETKSTVSATDTTVGGMAQASLILPESGQAEITIQSGEAASQRPLPISVAAPPTPTPTNTPTAMPSATPPPTHTATPAPTSTPTSTPGETDETSREGRELRRVDEIDLLAALSATALAGMLGFSWRRPRGRTSRQMRMGLLVLIGGLGGYLLYGLGWLRPETWLRFGDGQLAETGISVGRMTVATLAFIFGLATLALERPARRR